MMSQGNSERRFRREFLRMCQLRGYQVRPEALRRVLSAVPSSSLSEAKKNFSLILDRITVSESGKKVGTIDEETVESVLQSIQEGTTQEEYAELSSRPPEFLVVSAFEGRSSCLFGEAKDKPSMFKERLLRLTKRTQRNPAIGPELTQLEALIGTRSGQRCVLGLLTQMSEGEWHLEDSTGNIRVDLTQAETAAGFFPEHTLVLAQGVFENGCFRVSAIGLPPPQVRSFASKDMKQSLVQESVVVMSDVFLDEPAVFASAVHVVETASPDALVLCGDFSSSPLPRRSFASKIESFAAQIPSNTNFVLVPGPRDPSLSPNGALPRARIPQSFLGNISSVLPSAVISSSPCRVHFHGMEIVVFREDLLAKVARHSIFQPRVDESGDMTEHLVKTVIDEAHLCPLPQAAAPVFWRCDDAMRLDTLPDIIVLADRCPSYVWKYEGCTCVNPGSFAVDKQFAVIDASTGETEVYSC